MPLRFGRGRIIRIIRVHENEFVAAISQFNIVEGRPRQQFRAGRSDNEVDAVPANLGIRALPFIEAHGIRYAAVLYPFCGNAQIRSLLPTVPGRDQDLLRRLLGNDNRHSKFRSP